MWGLIRGLATKLWVLWTFQYFARETVLSVNGVAVSFGCEKVLVALVDS